MTTVRKIGCLLLAAVLCAALCSCNALDDLRARTVYLTGEGGIEIDGVTYRELDAGNVWFSRALFDTDKPTLNLCDDPQMPLFVAAVTGRAANISRNGDLISTFDETQGTDRCYCREDRIEWYTELLRAPVLDHMVTYIWTTGTEETDWESHLVPVMLDEKLTAGLLAAMEGEPLEEVPESEFRYGYLEIYMTDADNILEGNPCQILETEDGYCIISDVAYPLPKELNRSVKKLIDQSEDGSLDVYED